MDCAHLNEPGRREALALAKRPAIISHTGVKGVFNHPRNVSDESLRALAKNGGVVGIMFAPVFLGGKRKGSVGDVVRHIRHVIDLIGPRHVAVGSDLDGFIPSTPRGLEDMAALPALTRALLESGLDQTIVRGVLGQNVMDFWQRYTESGCETK
jgi:membrane dipeptidase